MTVDQRPFIKLIVLRYIALMIGVVVSFVAHGQEIVDVVSEEQARAYFERLEGKWIHRYVDREGEEKVFSVLSYRLSETKRGFVLVGTHDRDNEIEIFSYHRGSREIQWAAVQLSGNGRMIRKQPKEVRLSKCGKVAAWYEPKSREEAYRTAWSDDGNTLEVVFTNTTVGRDGTKRSWKTRVLDGPEEQSGTD